MDDARVGRDDLEVVEGVLAPPEELVPLPVAVELQGGVDVEGVRSAEHVGDHRVVDDQLGRRERVDPGRVAAQRSHRLAHRGQVHHARDSREVLHQHPGGRELDLLRGLRRRVPLGQRPGEACRDVHAILGAQLVLQEHLQAERQPVGAGYRVQAKDLVGGIADPQGVATAEAVHAHGHILSGRIVRCRLTPGSGLPCVPCGRCPVCPVSIDSLNFPGFLRPRPTAVPLLPRGCPAAPVPSAAAPPPASVRSRCRPEGRARAPRWWWG